MRFFFLFSCLAVTSVKARPEPPVFKGLQQRNERPLSLNAYIYQQLPHEQSFPNFAAPSATYGAPGLPPPDHTLATVIPETTAFETPSEDSYRAAYRHTSSQQYQNGYDHGPTETQVHKHIYFHAPPKDFEDHDAIQPRVRHQGGRKQKHYKIIFIKAPTGPTMHAPIVPPLPQNEEKTLIYVLHKKPEIQPDILIPEPEPAKPSKPEVYFIKYMTRREEAPVYGPPPALNAVKTPQVKKNKDNNLMPLDLGEYEMLTTTEQPEYEEEKKDESSAAGAEPTMTNFISEEAQHTTAKPPLKQYLALKTTLAPIVVKEVNEYPHRAASSSGSSIRSRFFH